MARRTAEQEKEHSIAKMGHELGSHFAVLWQEVASLHMKWEEYVALFGTTPERVETLNRTAPKYFRMLQDVLFEDMLLHVARLTDAHCVAGKENLTIRRLPDLVQDEVAKKAVAEAVESAVKTSAFARDWRNRRIAHHDLDLAISEPAKPLADASRRQVNEALAAIAKVLNVIDAHFRGSGTYFKVGYGPGGAASLLDVIESGLKSNQQREGRFAQGEFIVGEPARASTVRDSTPSVTTTSANQICRWAAWAMRWCRALLDAR
jgi:hypothetical protein